jgi:hypothetical protein
MEEMTQHCGDGNATRSNTKQVLDDVFEDMTSFEQLNKAYLNAIKQKRYRGEMLQFKSDLDSNLLRIQKELREEMFHFGPYRKHWIYVPKKRMVMSLPVESRIVQWCIYQVLNPFYDKMMIEDSYACRKEKGALKAAKRLQYWMRQAEGKLGNWYYVKIDISKYFYRVDHDILIRILEKQIKDRKLMRLLKSIIDSDGMRFGLPRYMNAEELTAEEWLTDVGMPIGNLTSQLFANIYLNELDQYAKHVLKIQKYDRYMDDIAILAPDKETAKYYLEKIKAYALEKLHLDLNAKTAIRPLGRIEFVGYIITPAKMKLRKETTRRIKSAMHGMCRRYFAGEMTKEEFDRRIASYKGMIQEVENKNLTERLNEIYLKEKERSEKKAQKGAA